MAIRNRGENTWRITVNNGYSTEGKAIRYTKTIHGSFKDAEKAEKILAAEIAKTRTTNHSPQKMNLHDFFQYWIENYGKQHLSPRTIELYTSEFYRINLALGAKPLDKIEPKHILMFYKNLQNCPRRDGRSGKLSSTSIRKYHTLLHLLFKRAVRWQMIFSNPADQVDPPSYEYKNEKIILDHEEVAHFLQLLKNEPMKHQLWCLLGIGLGLRRGEIFALQWKHVDFDNKTILIEQSAQYLRGKGVSIKDTKTKASERLLSLPDTVLDLLHLYRNEKQSERFTLANKWEGSKHFHEDFIFTTWNGHIAFPDSLNTWLARFVKKHTLPKITPHSFRHMAATYLINAGVDIRTVAGKLGHANSTTTQLVYSHLLRKAEFETASVMDNILRKNID